MDTTRVTLSQSLFRQFYHFFLQPNGQLSSAKLQQTTKHTNLYFGFATVRRAKFNSEDSRLNRCRCKIANHLLKHFQKTERRAKGVSLNNILYPELQ